MAPSTRQKQMQKRRKNTSIISELHSFSDLTTPTNN
jgi:hypothetical protein